MNEAQTELEYIDPALKKAGWGKNGSKILKQFAISQGRIIGKNKRSRPLKADYVLQYKNRNLAVIEAKALKKHYTEGVGQAKNYANLLHIRFAYATNGAEIYEIDTQESIEKDVYAYPSPDELWERTFPTPKDPEKIIIDEWRKRFFDIPFEDKGGTWQPRYYQDNAITQVLEAVSKGEKRILLTLATGTGKTAIAFQIAWKLFNAKWTLSLKGNRRPRILFLADRNILANQAFNDFNAFEDDALVRISPDEIRKKKKVPKNGNVFFTIFQTFMSGDNETPYFGEYKKDFFDFIIIDECHRGGARDESSWREILKHFEPAVQLGLTATPKRDVNVDTYKYFGDPVYIYSLKEGINDGFLTPFRVQEVQTTIDDYIYTDDDKVLLGADELDKTKEYTEKDFNRIIQIKEREEFRVKKFLELMGNQNQKTLVFCATQNHALLIRDLINQNTEVKNTDYCHRVTADDGSLGEQHLRNFQDNEKKYPAILTTSQKLSTGVNAPEIRNIVLLRPVNSMIEFKQIIGRGTRLFDGKAYFTIYDFVNAHTHFQDKDWDGEPLEPEEPKPPRPPKECKECGQTPCICEKPTDICTTCGNIPCTCEPETPKMIKIKLSDNKVRHLDSMVKTSFWSPDGKPISSGEFMKQLFGDIPTLFKNEQELREIWSLPSTRKQLLDALSAKGYSSEQLEDLRNVVHGENSDLFDVLAYIAYNQELTPRHQRAENVKPYLSKYNPKQQEFLNFVLKQYINAGVNELAEVKLSPLLLLKYGSIEDAKGELGDTKTIREMFINIQGHLYNRGEA